MTLLDPNSFISDQSGAITVDWVVITAAVVGLALGVVLILGGEFHDLSGDVTISLTEMDALESPFGDTN